MRTIRLQILGSYWATTRSRSADGIPPCAAGISATVHILYGEIYSDMKLLVGTTHLGLVLKNLI